MTSALPSSTSSFGISTESASPPWHLVHFDVHCARCGHDLRGQTEPVCPACRLEFSWAHAAPLEELTCGKCNYHLYGLADSRCPECGSAVDWNAALLRYRTSQKQLFEYRWRGRPIRSFVHTWFVALRPRVLWRSLELHDPPRLAPLALWMVIILVCTDLLVPTGLGFADFLGEWIATRGRAPSYLLELPTYLSSYLSQRSSHFPVGLYVVWCVLSFGALCIFRQSMRKCKVRTAHVVRVWAYASTALLPLAAFCWLITVILADISMRCGWSQPFRFLWLNDYQVFSLAALAVLVHMTWAIRQGYRHYLRMPHSLGIAIAAQVIACLGTVITWARLFV